VVARGEVCWLELAEEGRRPVCVLTRNEAIPKLRNVVVALITRTIRGIETEVQLDASDGMPRECAISLCNLRPCRKRSWSSQSQSWGPTRWPKSAEPLRLRPAATEYETASLRRSRRVRGDPSSAKSVGERDRCGTPQQVAGLQ